MFSFPFDKKKDFAISYFQETACLHVQIIFHLYMMIDGLHSFALLNVEDVPIKIKINVVPEIKSSLCLT